MKPHRIHTQSLLLYCLMHFLLAFLLLMLTQGLFWWVNRGLFAGQNGWLWLLGNLHFGLSGAAYALLPFFLLCCIPLRHRLFRLLCLAVESLGMAFLLAANIADIPYYQWTLRRTAGDIFSYLGQNFEGGLLFGQMIKDFWPYFLLWGIMMTLWLLA